MNTAADGAEKLMPQMPEAEMMIVTPNHQSATAVPRRSFKINLDDRILTAL
jgi:hypothetical protein